MAKSRWSGQNITPSGEIVGQYVDASNVGHGFVRARDGAITTIDDPDAGTGSNQGTFANMENPAGTIAGQYTDGSFVIHGFLRVKD